MHEQGSLGGFDELGLTGLENARCARILGFDFSEHFDISAFDDENLDVSPSYLLCTIKTGPCTTAKKKWTTNTRLACSTTPQKVIADKF